MADTQLTNESAKQAATEEYTRAGRTYRPHVDILESEDALWLWADMPGVDENSVDVELNENVLTLQGQVSTSDYESLTPVYTEYNVGNFAHSFRVPATIDAEKIKAKMEHGVLTLELPKREETKPRRIQIRAS